MTPSPKPASLRLARPLVAMVLAASTAAAALAQQPAPSQTAPAIDRARLEAAKELIRASGGEAQFDVVIDTMLRGQQGLFRQMHPGHAKDIDEVIDSLRAKFSARKGEIVAMVAPLYAEKFTVPELNEIIAFYRSAIGVKLLAEQPGIVQRSMVLGMNWGQQIGREVELETRGALKRKGLPL